MTSPEQLAANMRQTTEALVMAFDNKWDLAATLAPRAPECVHVMLPNFRGSPTRNNEEWAAYFSTIAPLIVEAKMTIDDYLAVPAERRVVCRSSMTATTVVGPFINEYVWFLTFNDSGEKIVNITEFLGRGAEGKLKEKIEEAKLSKE